MLHLLVVASSLVSLSWAEEILWHHRPILKRLAPSFEEEGRDDYCPQPLVTDSDPGIGPIDALWKPRSFAGKIPPAAYFVVVGMYGVQGNGGSAPVALKAEFARFRKIPTSLPDIFTHVDNKLDQLALDSTDDNRWKSLGESLAHVLYVVNHQPAFKKKMKERKYKSTVKVTSALKKAVDLIRRLRKLRIDCDFQYGGNNAVGNERYTDLEVTCTPSDFQDVYTNKLPLTKQRITRVVREALETRYQSPSCNCYDNPNYFVSAGTMTFDSELIRVLSGAGVFVAMVGSDAGCTPELEAAYDEKSQRTMGAVGTAAPYVYAALIADKLAQIVDTVLTQPLSNQQLQIVSDKQADLLQRLTNLKDKDDNPATVLKSVLKLKNGEGLFVFRKGTSGSLKALSATDPVIHPKLQQYMDADKIAHHLAKEIVAGTKPTIDLVDFQSLNQGNHMRTSDNSPLGNQWVGESSAAKAYAVYVAPSEVAGAVDRLLNWFNTKVTSNDINTQAIIIGAQAFSWCVSIHPFHDGNGRACRLLADIAFMVGGLPPGVWSETAGAFGLLVKVDQNDSMSGPFDQTAKTEQIIRSGIIAAEGAVDLLCGEGADCN